jgi:hypothetical protein
LFERGNVRRTRVTSKIFFWEFLALVVELCWSIRKNILSINKFFITQYILFFRYYDKKRLDLSLP